MIRHEFIMTELPPRTMVPPTAPGKGIPGNTENMSYQSASNNVQYLSGWRLSLLTIGSA